MESGPLLAIILLTVVHFIGIVALFAFAGGDMIEIFRTKPADHGDDGGEPRTDEPEDAPVPGGGELLPPLPSAEQAGVRLREPGRIAEHYRRPRRPDHVPERAPQRENA